MAAKLAMTELDRLVSNISITVASIDRGIDAAGGAEVAFDSDDVHIRSLLSLSSGELLMGTAGEGLVLVFQRRDLIAVNGETWPAHRA